MIPDTAISLAADADTAPLFSAPYAPTDEAIAAILLGEASRAAEAERRIDAYARRLIEGIRARAGGLGGIEDFLHAYSLSTKEGLALMVLAEALLRVPDAATADRLIEDKLATGEWSSHHVKSSALLVSASAWTLGVTARIIHPGETPDTILESLIKRLGIPAVRAATRQAMRLLGSHFVLGQTIEEALERARTQRARRYSFDMLGEGARTGADAERYFASYAHAIDAIAASAGDSANRPGISVKLSALHPRFEAVSRHRVLTELVPRVLELARKARDLDLNFTVDAEEADRLELTLDVIAAVLADASLRGWDGFGLAVQAYQKRAPAVIDWLDEAARRLRRRLTVRLVKGAYWDSEIKRAQERGLSDYPVFTRKAMTDVCYAACTRKLLAARPRLYPQFATHNALTVASVIEDAGGVEGYEFQRLHGMGEVLYQLLLADHPRATCRIYAPVGSHRDLLAYLVRRLLENGANSSFVSVAADPAVPIGSILERPQERIGDARHARNPKIPLPRDLYGPDRRNSSGVEFGDRAALTALLAEIRAGELLAEAWPLIDGTKRPGTERRVLSPIDAKAIGRVGEANDALAAAAMAAAQAGFLPWAAAALDVRAGVLERAGDLLEARRGRLIALLQAEGGKTLDDAVAEVREAVDFCRYYALEARRTLAPQVLPGPTGEANELRYRGRGVFACISPWNFPLSIFLGQISAALVAGNAVVAKPAEQTPLIAAEVVRALHQAGVPASALHLLPGDGKVGAALVADPRVGGEGSTHRAADRGDRRHQSDDRRCHRAAGASHRRRGDVGVPFRRPALLGAAPAVRAGGRGRADRRDDRGRRARAQARRPARAFDPCWAGDRCRGQGQARPLDRRPRAEEPRALPLGLVQLVAGERDLCAAGDHHARARGGFARGGVRADPARRALAQWGARRAARRNRRQRLRPHARHPFPHRCYRRPRRCAARPRQRLRQSQHDRRGRRHAAVRRCRALRHRAEGGRSELPEALCHRAGGDHQHRGGRRQCLAARRRRVGCRAELRSLLRCTRNAGCPRPCVRCSARLPCFTHIR